MMASDLCQVGELVPQLCFNGTSTADLITKMASDLCQVGALVPQLCHEPKVIHLQTSSLILSQLSARSEQ